MAADTAILWLKTNWFSMRPQEHKKKTRTHEKNVRRRRQGIHHNLERPPRWGWLQRRLKSDAHAHVCVTINFHAFFKCTAQNELAGEHIVDKHMHKSCTAINHNWVLTFLSPAVWEYVNARERSRACVWFTVGRVQPDDVQTLRLYGLYTATRPFCCSARAHSAFVFTSFMMRPNNARHTAFAGPLRAH